MSAGEILAAIETRGMVAKVHAGRLVVGPGSLMTDELREQIKGHSSDLLAALVTEDEALRWRVAAMLR